MIRGNGTLPEAINIFAKGFSAVGPWRYRVGLTGNRHQLPASLTVGTPVTVFPRGGQHSLRLINCTECTVTNLTIHGGSSMGIVDSDGGGGNTYLAVTIARTDTPSLIGLPPRLLATNADGFHSTTNRRGPALLRSEIGFTGDDAGNICSAMSVLLPPPPAHTGVQQRWATPSALFVDVGGNLKTAVKGDVILFYNISTGEPLGEATVAAVPTSTSAAPSVQTMRQAFATMMAPPISAHFVTEVQGHFERGLPVVVPLTAPLAPALQGLWSVGVLMSTANAGAMVHDTVIHDACDPPPPILPCICSITVLNVRIECPLYRLTVLPRPSQVRTGVHDKRTQCNVRILCHPLSLIAVPSQLLPACTEVALG